MNEIYAIRSQRVKIGKVFLQIQKDKILYKKNLTCLEFEEFGLAQNVHSNQRKGRTGVLSQKGHAMLVEGNIYYRYASTQQGMRIEGCLGNDEVLSGYLRYGTDFFTEKCEGDFNVFIYEIQSGKLAIINDRYGLRPLYYGLHGHDVIFSSDLGGVLSSGIVNVKLSEKELISFLYLAKLKLGENTVFEGIKVLPAATICFSDKNGLSLNKYWTDRFQPVNFQSEEEAASEAARLFHEGVNKRLEAESTFGLCLTGGLDSRSIAGAIDESNLEKVRAFTWGSPDCTEIRIASQVATTRGVNHRILETGPINFLENAYEQYSVVPEPDIFIQSHMFGVAEQMKAEAEIIMTGLSLGTTLGGYFLNDEVLKLNNDSAIISYLLFSVGILGISSNAYSGFHVSGQFRRSKKEGIRGDVFSDFNPGDDTSFDHQIQTGLMQLLFKSKNTIECTWPFGISLL